MSKNGYIILSAGVCVALLFACLVTSQVAAADSDPILSARAAVRAGDDTKFKRSLAAAHGHILEPYVRYWGLAPRIGQAPSSEITAFLQAHAGTLLAEILRSQWLKYLGSQALWHDFDREYPLLERTDRELQCYALQSRLARDESGALDAAGDLWLNVDLSQACDAPLAALHAAKRVSTEDVWARTRRLLDDGQNSAANTTARLLPPDEQPDSATLAQVVETPGAFLDLQDARFSGSRMQQELSAAALARLARSDLNAAAMRCESPEARLSDAQRRYVYAQLGWQAARRHLPEALTWYKAAGDSLLSDEQITWQARAALRAGDWQGVLGTIDAMPPQLSTQPDWIYWRARALAALGRVEEAQLLYRAIAGQTHFYGILADEELGHTIDVPPRAAPPSSVELAEITEQPGIARALALRRIGLRTLAIREWNWALRGQSDRFLLAAAEYARRNRMFDRAISAAESTQTEHDFALRYLAPFRDEVEPKARARDLDEAWVYGLIRQESRFNADARSGVGASGLMQLMPATAQWLGRKLGMRRLSARRISDRETNIMLGTSYLKLVLTDLDGQPLVASAAYNAGPGRARRWRGDEALEGAIYAETIPIGETRDYVKQVMSNAVYYAALFEGKPQSLKARLGIVGSRANGRFPPERIASAQRE